MTCVACFHNLWVSSSSILPCKKIKVSVVISTDVLLLNYHSDSYRHEEKLTLNKNTKNTLEI